MYNRNDYFLIWGHGIKFQDKIIDLIEKNKNFTIKYFYKYKIKNINKFISNIYFNDYTPINHLKNKTKYLKKTNQEVLFIFVENKLPKEFKVKAFNKYHIESQTINSFKNLIRYKFNPKIEGKITHDHVIHGSDNHNQTKHIIKFLGHRNLNYSTIYESEQNNFEFQSSYEFKKILFKKIKARILINQPSSKTKLVDIVKTPHFKFLKKKRKQYLKYIKLFRGIGLNKYYSEKKFKNLIKNFKYLKNKFQRNHICAEKVGKNYVITDGLHRASILKHLGNKNLIIKQKIY